ncbi:MAG: M13 family metallopeptidase [Oscillospiraceae bacterium]|jgi:putative endopeptidase|nr:M13 family metallopeptidase [Oscillospiraceae bacterium]
MYIWKFIFRKEVDCVKKTFKRTVCVLSCLLLLLLLPAALASPASAPSPKEDFYEAINADWLATTELPPDQFSVGGFGTLENQVPETLMADFDRMLRDGVQPEDPRLAQFLRFYAMASDYERRNADGFSPAQPYLERIQKLDSLAALDSQLSDWLLTGLSLPFQVSVEINAKDARVYTIYFVAPSLILPDPSYYAQDNPYGPMLLQAFGGVARQLLGQAGYGEEEAATIVQNALAFDASLVPYAKTAEESADITSLYHPQALADFTGSIRAVNLAAMVDALTDHPPEEVIVTDPRFFEAFDGLVTEETFPQLKDWLLVQTVRSLASFLSETAMELGNSYANILTGQAQSQPVERQAYSAANAFFSEVVGLYYGQTYFGPQARDQVTAMVERMVAVYRSRLEHNDWLGEATRAMALRKLDALAIRVGYPDAVDPVYDAFLVTPAEEGGTLLSNAMHFTRLAMEAMFARLSQPVDRDAWAMSADTVNAGYNALSNNITFPAAILQAPFYSLEQSASANYGGIGAVIAHEISHAFDPNGSKFDEYGSYVDWWTPEDHTQFEALSEKMVAVFDGLSFADGTVNGRQTLSENVADAGGLSCALQVVQSLPDGDVAAFFTNWATIWRIRSTAQFEQLLLTLDVHAPNKLRANIQPQMFEAFFEAFGISEGDAMYRAPEDRVSIW